MRRKSSVSCKTSRIELCNRTTGRQAEIKTIGQEFRPSHGMIYSVGKKYTNTYTHTYIFYWFCFSGEPDECGHINGRREPRTQVCRFKSWDSYEVWLTPFGSMAWTAQFLLCTGLHCLGEGWGRSGLSEPGWRRRNSEEELSKMSSCVSQDRNESPTLINFA